MNNEMYINLKGTIEILNGEKENNLKALFLTASGLIIGDICEITDNPIKPNSNEVDISYVAYNNKETALNLENVTFKPISDLKSSIKFPQMILMINQIISFSVTDPKIFENLK